jgi:homoisocitrate dehydrogenase
MVNAAASATELSESRTENTFNLCIIEGDGIGHEVIPAAVELLSATGFNYNIVSANAGWETFLKYGTALPEITIERAAKSDAILFGAVSSPSYKVQGYSSPIVELRRRLQLFANLRPTHSWPISNSRQGIDLLIVRENTEGLYVRQETNDGTTAIAKRIITKHASQRITQVACSLAQQRRHHLTIVHKANVLSETCGLFRQTALEVASQHPDLEIDEMLVDAMALRLVTHPDKYDVIVTTNLFGDILSDEAAGLVGGLGLAPSANVGSNRSPALFEPVHGSAPDIAGKNIANPIAAFMAVAMLLEHNGEINRASIIRKAITSIIQHGPHTPDLGGNGMTEDVTIAVINMVKSSNVATA